MERGSVVETKNQLLGLGIPETQVDLVKKHLEAARGHLFEVDPGIHGAFAWLKKSLNQYLEPNEADLLFDIALKNKPEPEVEYKEEGYDSCQSHRKVAKVVGEAILLGGLIHEGGLLGLAIDLDKAKQLANSSLKIDPNQGSKLAEIAKRYGAKQDFLFPGVTPSSEETCSLDELAYQALCGKPKTSVRTVTGVGGLRYDKDWNYVTDFATFVNLKVSEDKRYYPGLGIFYFLLNADLESLPVIEPLKQKQPETYLQFLKFAGAVKGIEKHEFSGISILCSAYLPPWTETKRVLVGLLPSHEYIEVAEAFHSPSYDLSMLKYALEQINNDNHVNVKTLEKVFAVLTQKLGHLWTFNSTIHLPWTADLAWLSNDLIGKISNHLGDFGIRYGIGYKGKSIEIREYNLSEKRLTSYELNGTRAYLLIYYPESGKFEGQSESFILAPKSDFWGAVKKHGFIKTALAFLETKHD